MNECVNKVVMITGGGTGIGRATAELFAAHGARIVVNYSRSQQEADATVAQIVAGGGEAIAVRADVSKDQEVRAMVAHAVATFGQLDILVNNAGWTEFVSYRKLESLTDEIWDRVMAVNLKGAFYASRAAIGAMRERQGGQIVNVSSLSAMTGQGSSIVYAASKAALVNMTQALAISQAPDIRVNAVAPGVVQTRWIRDMESFVDEHRQSTPLQRLAQPEDVALAIYGLAMNPFITGQTVVVDGGRILRH